MSNPTSSRKEYRDGDHESLSSDAILGGSTLKVAHWKRFCAVSYHSNILHHTAANVIMKQLLLLFISSNHHETVAVATSQIKHG